METKKPTNNKKSISGSTAISGNKATKPKQTAIAETYKIRASNKRAHFEYFFIEKYKAGIILSGTEVKSVKSGKLNMSDAYCFFKDSELWVKNLHISEYERGGVYNHEPKNARKLLLNKRELKRLEQKIKERGLTIVPIEVLETERGYIKLEIALAKGKKAYDKRDSIKEKDQRRDFDRQASHND